MSSEDQQALRLRLVYFMRRLLLAPLILVLSSCSYGSYYEADKACQKWVSKGGSYEYESNTSKRTYVSTSKLRECLIEEDTKQILGFTDTGKKNGDFYKYGERWPNRKMKLIKRFKY